MDLNSILGALTAGSAVSDMGRQFNMNSNQVNSVITSALPTLIGAMQKNTATESGASSLAGALASHLGDGINLSSASLTDGSKILGHILGGNAASELNGLAAQTGLSANEVGSALSGIAPALLSGLSAATSSSGAAGKVDLSDGLDLGDVMAMLGGGQSAAPAGGLLGSLLGGGQSNASSGGLLSSLLGGGQSNASSGGLLGSLFGGSQNSAPAAGGLLGSLLSGGIQENDNSLNGNALMSALLSAMK